MAKATVTFPQPALVPPPTITLELSIEEAEALLVVGYLVGGNPNGSRGRIDAIVNAIRSTGTQLVIRRPTSATIPATGSIYFTR